VSKIAFKGAHWEVTHRGEGDGSALVAATHVICSAPLGEVVGAVWPPLSDRTRQAARQLRYRDFILVALILVERHRLTDQWVYVHSPGVRAARLQNFKAWSPEMVPDPRLCCYGVEYFCSDTDDLARRPDAALVELAAREVVEMGLADAGDVVDGFVIRQPKAYPVYADAYASRVREIREELETRFPSLHQVGRNGLHRYNNQDHAMVTAMLAVNNILAGRRAYDVWRVNSDAQYLEDRAGVPPGQAAD
jgi:protoporphyrinogen oxidase